MPYSLAGPPPHAGLYLVKNTATGQVYLGKTNDMSRRFNEWRSSIATGLRLPNEVVEEAIASSDPQDWQFEVIMKCGLDNLQQYETRALAETMQRYGSLCLNIPKATKPRDRAAQNPQGVSLPLSEVLDEYGIAMTHSEIARRLKINAKSVQKRLARLRKAGRFALSVNDLLSQKKIPV